MDVAEAPDGTARMISDWQPFAQGGGGSGLAAQVAETTGTGPISFGQQINLPDAVAPSAQIAAVYIESNGKFFGYFPVINAGVYLADISNPTGNSAPGNAIQPVSAINWASGAISGTGARVHAKHVVIPGYDKYLLVGSTPADDVIHVAEINTSTGIPIEIASRTGSAQGNSLEIGIVNNEIFIFAASSNAGLKVYKFTPPSLLTEVTVPAAISGNIKKVDVSGPPPFPALSLYRDAGGSGSFVDIYDTKWLQGSNPIRARSLEHYLADDASYRGAGFESWVVQNGGTVSAYIYRELNPPPPGLPSVQSPIHTDKIDISCIAADPDAPPIPFAAMTNLSAAGRTSPENTKNYFGDKWQIADASVSFLPILKLEWDFHYTGAFAPEITLNGVDLRGYSYNPAYWPCDALSGGNIGTGTGCHSSLGPIVSTYQLALQAENVNIPDTQTFVSQSYALLQPQISIVGFDGTTLSVLAGNPNNGDASATQGNVAEATFNWTFTPSGTATGQIVTIPLTATSFTLTVTYKTGYSTSKTGPIQQVDLVPNFSLTPNPVLKSASLTLRNLMQKAAAATLNSVTYAITPTGGSGTLAGSFLPVNGTAPVTAPGTVGNYSMTLTYHYTDHLGQPKTAPVSMPFSVTDFAPVPALGIYKTATHTQPVFPIGNPPSFGLTSGTTYYLYDDETLPGGVQHPGRGVLQEQRRQPVHRRRRHFHWNDHERRAPDLRLGARVLHELLHQGLGPGDRAGVQVHGDQRRGRRWWRRWWRRRRWRWDTDSDSERPGHRSDRRAGQLHRDRLQLPGRGFLRLGLRRWRWRRWWRWRRRWRQLPAHRARLPGLAGNQRRGCLYAGPGHEHAHLRRGRHVHRAGAGGLGQHREEREPFDLDRPGWPPAAAEHVQRRRRGFQRVQQLVQRPGRVPRDVHGRGDRSHGDLRVGLRRRLLAAGLDRQ